MAIDPFLQVLLVVIPLIVALFVVYIWFDMNWNYLLYFTIIFILVFVGTGVIDWYYVSIVILVFSLLIYQSVNAYIRQRRGSE